MPRHSIEPLAVPALGRPAALGMLYDSYTETLVPCLGPWPQSVITKLTSSRNGPVSTKFSILTLNDVSSGMDHVDCSINLKMRVASGAFSLEGSGSYLKENKRSDKEASVTLKYHAETVFEQVALAELQELPKSGDDRFGSATHIISGILYGADIYCVYRQKLASSETQNDVQGRLEVRVGVIPGILSVGGLGGVKKQDTIASSSEQISCTFYSDALSESCPVSFEDSLTVFQNTIKKIEKGVPIKIWLHPLHNLFPRLPSALHRLDDNSMMPILRHLQSLTANKNKLDDLCDLEAVQWSDRLKSQSLAMKANIEKYEKILGQEIQTILEKYRLGNTNETECVAAFARHLKSPFSNSVIEGWLNSKRRDAGCLLPLLKGLQTANVTMQCDSMSSGSGPVRILHLNLGLKMDALLNSQTELLSQSSGGMMKNDSFNSQCADKSWFDSPETMTLIRSRVKQFISEAKTSQEENSNVQFIVKEDFAGEVGARIDSS